jgi:hypothetical protein
MRPLSVPELLNVWERGWAARPFERALAILATAAPESSALALANLSIGQRDASLLRLRECAFGSELPMLAECPRCHNALETTVAVRDLCARFDASGDSETSLTVGRYKLRCRAPNTADLEACVGLDPEKSRRTLFTNCVLEASCGDDAVSSSELPDTIVEAVIRRIAEAGGAEMRMDLTCPDCKYCWNEVFDIVSFFWTEIDAWARRLLREVHVLAAVYGWNERDILSLSPLRRQIYLAMAEA